MPKTSLNRFLGQFLKTRQILKSPKLNFDRQMVHKVTPNGYKLPNLAALDVIEIYADDQHWRQSVQRT